MPPGNPPGPIAQRRARLEGAGKHVGEQRGLHGNDGLGLESQGLVGADAARGFGALAGPTARGETVGPGTGVQDVRAGLRPAALPISAYGSEVGVSLIVVESAPANFLAFGDSVTLLTDGPRSRDPDVPIRRGVESNDAERAVTHKRDYIGVP